ncbi:MAG: hypothetical protein K9K68_05970 [Methylococcaceae bacterium]|nr:hypothetical protein [Methylococcaceae bacterium]
MKPHLVRGLIEELKANIEEELLALSSMVRANRTILIMLLVSVFLILLWINPLPPKKVYLATGQPGSSYQLLGEKFAQYFARYGIELVPVDSPGINDRLSKLTDDESPVSSTFYVAGGPDVEDLQDVVSLGSIRYSPLWLLYRGQPVEDDNAIRYFSDKTIAVGTRDNSTQSIFRKIIELHGLSLVGMKNFLELPNMEAAQRLRQGSIDAMFLIDSIDSPLIQSLIADPEIHIFDFKLADAYTKRLPFLEKLVIPRGALDLQRLYPPRDINLLGTTVTLLVEADTHPVIQWIFLKAARHIGNERPQFFAEPDFFPAYLDRSLPLSDVAKRFYQSGFPPLAKYMPLWMADYIDRVWFHLLAALAMIIPGIQLIGGARQYYSDKVIENAYRRLRRIEDGAAQLSSPQEAAALMEEWQQFSHDIAELWVSSENVKSLFALKRAAKHVRDRIRERVTELSQEAP